MECVSKNVSIALDYKVDCTNLLHQVAFKTKLPFLSHKCLNRLKGHPTLSATKHPLA